MQRFYQPYKSAEWGLFKAVQQYYQPYSSDACTRRYSSILNITVVQGGAYVRRYSSAYAGILAALYREYALFVWAFVFRVTAVPTDFNRPLPYIAWLPYCKRLIYIGPAAVYSRGRPVRIYIL